MDIQQLVCVMRLCCLAVGRILRLNTLLGTGKETSTNGERAGYSEFVLVPRNKYRDGTLNWP